MATILFSQVPAGHVALVLADRANNEDVAEVFLKLEAVAACGLHTAKPGRIFAQRIKAPSFGSLVTEEDVARRGTDFANGELSGHDPRSHALFPIDEDISRFKVGSLRPALTAGRDFLDVIARGSAITEIKEEAERLAESVQPLIYGSQLESVGVESDLVALLRGDTGAFGARAKLRLKLPRPVEALLAGDALEVTISARVYDHVPQHGLPLVPFAQGPEVRRRARLNEWTVVDIELPPVQHRPDGYFVQAKVHSSDPRYRKSFEPSECYARQLHYGT